jgi:quinol-cytochrome oxidoreductase complex cytochrome b subunit
LFRLSGLVLTELFLPHLLLLELLLPALFLLHLLLARDGNIWFLSWRSLLPLLWR